MKKALIALAAVVLLVGGALLYMNHRNRTLSPPAEQTITTAGGLTVNIAYSRPSVRGRLVFGDSNDGALQPYGVYWRLGANEATVFEFSEEVMVRGTRIPPGKYGVYAFPGPDQFEIGINKTYDRWGFSEPDYSQDLIRFNVPVKRSGETIEQFTISLIEMDEGVTIVCEWDDVRFEIPVQEI